MPKQSSCICCADVSKGRCCFRILFPFGQVFVSILDRYLILKKNHERSLWKEKSNRNSCDLQEQYVGHQLMLYYITFQSTVPANRNNMPVFILAIVTCCEDNVFVFKFCFNKNQRQGWLLYQTKIKQILFSIFVIYRFKIGRLR